MIPRLPLAMRIVTAALTLTVALAATITPPETVSATSSGLLTNGQGTLFFVGDSLTVGTKAFGNLQRRIVETGIWDRVVIDARVGRRADQSLSVLKKKMPLSTTAIVVALGTNDVISRREPNYPAWVINKVMESSKGLPVLWFNTEFSTTGRGDWRFRSRRFNRALRDAQEEWSNLVIADWYNFFTPKGKSRFQFDGIHLSVTAYKLRAIFSESQIRQFGEAIVNATTSTSLEPTSTTVPTLPTTSTSSTSLPSTTTSSTSSVPPPP